jgi:hypothetical protein
MPTTPADREVVREQLGRVLSSTLFRNSKRFPVFLRYTVEHALSSTDPLKERTIGHEVFARDPGYDTAQDPVVRMTAGEVRKRLAQYYLQPEHEGELVITYQSGSYVPEFSLPRPAERQEAAAVAPPVAAPPVAERRRVAITSVAAVVAVFLLTLMVRALWGHALANNAMTRFWAPVLTSAAPVLICIGDPGRVDQRLDANSAPIAENASNFSVDEFLRRNAVRYTDAVTLALLAGELRSRDKPFRIRRPAATELKDLRDGPVVLIGGFNNPWTLRLSEGLRFTLAEDAGGPYLRDREHPEDRQWQAVPSGQPIKSMTKTYGLITRVHDPATGNSVLTVAGLVLGTRAAGECLIDKECLETAERMGKGPADRNVQIVVSAAVIGEDSGAPQVVALHTW